MILLSIPSLWYHRKVGIINYLRRLPIIQTINWLFLSFDNWIWFNWSPILAVQSSSSRVLIDTSISCYTFLTLQLVPIRLISLRRGASSSFIFLGNSLFYWCHFVIYSLLGWKLDLAITAVWSRLAVSHNFLLCFWRLFLLKVILWGVLNNTWLFW